jgi:hypothetical protein
MIEDPVVQHPLSWTDPSLTLNPYDLIFLPGGHEKGVRQIIDSPATVGTMLLKMLLILFSTAAPAGRALSDPRNYECPEWAQRLGLLKFARFSRFCNSRKAH